MTENKGPIKRCSLYRGIGPYTSPRQHMIAPENGQLTKERHIAENVQPIYVMTGLA